MMKALSKAWGKATSSPLMPCVKTLLQIRVNSMKNPVLTKFKILKIILNIWSVNRFDTNLRLLKTGVIKND